MYANLPQGVKRMKTRARLMVGLLAAALAGSACGSRLGTGELEAANGVLTKHSTAVWGAGATAGSRDAVAAPAVSTDTAGATGASSADNSSAAGAGAGAAAGGSAA